MEKNNKRSIIQNLTTLLFILLVLGSVFIVSSKDYDLFETYRKYWTIIVGLMCFIGQGLGNLMNKGKMKLPIDTFFKTIFVAGILESTYALLQFFKILPSYNHFYAYTGSFENPAIFAMLLSVCVPIAVYYARQFTKSRILWWIAAAGMLIFIGFSESRTGIMAAIISSTIVLLSSSDSLHRKIFNRSTLMILIPFATILLILLYRFKADSANGRLLMWRVSMDMIKEQPFLGYGPDGFTAHYMEHQAKYLTANSNSPFILLADNVNNPFNEYLLVLVNYGILGFFLLLFLLVILLYRLNLLHIPHRPLLISLTIALMIWSFFSYPYSIPFTWVITYMIVIVTIYPILRNHYVSANIAIITSCLIGLFIAVYNYFPEREWKIISQRSIQGETEVLLPDYNRLYGRLYNNWKFLYNYGAELHYIKHYNESLAILEECKIKLNDYDVQMLIGDCLQNIGDTIKAIEHYRNASNMVPSKFLPHYYIMNLYLNKCDTVKAISTANVILEKDIKVIHSKTVQRIIREAQELIDQSINNDH